MNPNPISTEPHISRLFIYPIKSCGGMELSTAQLTETGLAHDRQFMLVDAQGRFLSQRELARMALIHPQIDGALLRVQAPGMAELVLPLAAPSDTSVDTPALLPVQLWGYNMPALDVGIEAADWFGAFLGQTGVRLVRFDPSHRRASDTKWTGDATALNQFSDGFPILVLSQSALDGLNQRLLAQGWPAATLQRFRPNIVIDGVPEHEEDLAVALQLSDANEPIRLGLVKPCPRCPIPNIDPSSAISTPHVTDCLNTYRHDARVNGAVSFGMNAILRSGVGQTVRVGQAMELDYGFE